MSDYSFIHSFKYSLCYFCLWTEWRIRHSSFAFSFKVLVFFIYSFSRSQIYFNARRKSKETEEEEKTHTQISKPYITYSVPCRLSHLPANINRIHSIHLTFVVLSYRWLLLVMCEHGTGGGSCKNRLKRIELNCCAYIDINLYLVTWTSKQQQFVV